MIILVDIHPFWSRAFFLSLIKALPFILSAVYYWYHSLDTKRKNGGSIPGHELAPYSFGYSLAARAKTKGERILRFLLFCFLISALVATVGVLLKRGFAELNFGDWEILFFLCFVLLILPLLF